MREFDVLSHIYAANSSLAGPVLIGPGDDMAMIELGGRKLLAAVDQLIDGRHVTLETTPIALVGRKAITRSLSDIAAMAAVPLATLVAATLPAGFQPERAKALFDSMRAVAQHYRCPLIGGDLAFHKDSSYPLVCAVTVLAEPGDAVVTRRGAKIGDRVYVTGRLGGSLEPGGLGRHLTFEPRIDLALRLVSALGERLHAMIDISDGLGRDASHIAEMSNVQIRLYAHQIPCNPGCAWQRALSDGEDYELCFTAPPPIPAMFNGDEVFEVGEVVQREVNGPHVVIQHGDEILPGDDLGWQHRSGA